MCFLKLKNSSNKNNVDQFLNALKNEQQNLFDNIRKK